MCGSWFKGCTPFLLYERMEQEYGKGKIEEDGIGYFGIVGVSGNNADAAALGIIQGNPDGTYCFDCNGLKPFDEFKAEVAEKGADVSKLEVYLWSVPDEYIKKQ